MLPFFQDVLFVYVVATDVSLWGYTLQIPLTKQKKKFKEKTRQYFLPSSLLLLLLITILIN